MEEWKDIPNYEGKYQISNIGRLRSLKHRWGKRKQPKIMSLTTTADGYKRGYLTKDGKTKGISVHRLVAMAFIGMPKKKKCINHKNGIKTDNRPSNLEWCTREENIQHSVEMGMHVRGERHADARLCKEDVLDIRQKYKTGEMTSKELSKKYGVCQRHVHNIIARNKWKHI